MKRHLVVLTIVLSLGGVSAAADPPKFVRPPTKARENRALEWAQALPREASAEKLAAELPRILEELRAARGSDRESAEAAIAALALQPRIVDALSSRYAAIAPDSYVERRLVVGVMGALRRPDALGRLVQLAMAPLPPAPQKPKTHVVTRRTEEEMVEARAVDGIAYLRTPAAFAAVRQIALQHESRFVRIEAIDAYLWNHGDSPEAIRELRSLVPAAERRYVGMPRFAPGTDAAEFSQKLRRQRQAAPQGPQP